MSVTMKIGENSICCGCNTTPIQERCVQCFTCKVLFHAICQGTDAVLGSKTLVKTFLAASTKPNFKFFCDICVTESKTCWVRGEDWQYREET